MVNLSAQNITGHVYKAEDHSPVQFGNVVLLNLPDSSFNTGVVTYMEGEYSIKNVKPGEYLVKVSYMGYETKMEHISVGENSHDIQLEDFVLNAESQNINEVKVTANMIRGKELVDRTVYEIPPEIEKSSTTGYDILKKIPSVQVDFNNNISISGKNNFIIEVDGKQRDAEFLNRIMPEDIESIEIIHNPSGRYDGTIDAVLNIKLKPEARAGISGNIGAMVKPLGKPTAALNAGIDYGLKKITFYVSGFSFIQNLDNTSRISNQFLIFDPDSINNQVGNGDFSISASSLNTGFDYYLNKKNSLSLNYNLRPNHTKNKLNYTGSILRGETPIFLNGSETNTNNSSNESNISLFYKHEFNKPIQELTSENNFYFFNASDNNDFQNYLSELNGQSIEELLREESSLNKRKYFSSKWNYVHPLGMSMRVETGVQFYYQMMDYEFESNDTVMNNTYAYHEWRNAAYAGFTLNKKKLGFQVNLRIERSDIGMDNANANGYFTFLPSTNLQYKINSNQNIKLTYNRRISRPNIYNLNPNIRYNSNNTYTKGNLELKPELRDRLQLTYTMNFGKSFISPNIYYEFLSDKVSNRNLLSASPVNGAPTIVSQPQNLLTGYEMGFGMSGFVKFVYLDARIYKGHFEKFSDTLSQINARNYFSYSITNYFTVPLFKEKVNTFVFLNYRGISYDAQSKTYNPFLYGLGANMKIKENHTIGIFYLLPFQHELEFSKTITSTELLYTETSNNFNTDYFIQLQYHYKFNKGKAVKKLGKKSEFESDTKGGGLGR